MVNTMTISVRNVDRDVYREAQHVLVDTGMTMGAFITQALRSEIARLKDKRKEIDFNNQAWEKKIGKGG